MELNKYTNKDEYLKKLNVLDIKKSNGIPVFISENRPDLINNLNALNKLGLSGSEIFKSNYGLIISKEINGLQKNTILCNKWINPCDKISNNSTLLIIGLYKDFNEKNILDLLHRCRRLNINVFFLLGRDLSSLSWLIAKQFLNYNEKFEINGLFSFKNLNKVKQNYKNNWKVFDSSDLDKKNIKEIIENNRWNKLIFHGHGKEDHLNLNDFTLNGFNNSIPKSELFAPSIGHDNQGFFKDINKAISMNKVMVEYLYLLSCNNFPFNDDKLYGSRYNLVLNSIDGFAKNIIASISVQSADIPEIEIILNSSSTKFIDSVLDKNLNDIQPFISIINIGLPDVNSHNKKFVNEDFRLSDTSKIILSRVSSYYGSMMLTENHPVNVLAQKIMKDYSQLTRRGTSDENIKNFEQGIINRVNPFSKVIATTMMNDQNDQLHSFDSFNIYRSILNKNSIKYSNCVCGSKLIKCSYIPDITSLFQIDSEFCYRCGDKTASMVGMPQIIFSCDEFNVNEYEINYKIEISSKSKGDVFLGIQLPGYVEDYLKENPLLSKIKFKNPGTKYISGKVAFNKNTPLQSYYLKLLVVQNGGIAISRCFFNLIEN